MNHRLGLLSAVAAIALAAVLAPRMRAHAHNDESPNAEISSLEKELVGEYLHAYEAARRSAQTGQFTAQQVREAKVTYLEIQLEFTKPKPERIKLLDEIVQESRAELQAMQQMQKGLIPAHELFVARVNLLRARIALEKEKSRS